jgi:hypothetical protein
MYRTSNQDYNPNSIVQGSVVAPQFTVSVLEFVEGKVGEVDVPLFL